MRVAICECGVGNVRSVVRAIEHALAAASREGRIEVTSDPDAIRAADRVVVPGQGSFGAFAAAIGSGRGLGEAITERVTQGAPYLGICLGLQVLFEGSEEAPEARGLGVLRGQVKRLTPGADPRTGRTLALPHMGWNEVVPVRGGARHGALGVETTHFYFAHSFAAAPIDADVVAATTEYGAATFASVVARGEVLGVQFHPEKSQRAGLSLLERFFR